MIRKNDGKRRRTRKKTQCSLATTLSRSSCCNRSPYYRRSIPACCQNVNRRNRLASLIDLVTVASTFSNGIDRSFKLFLAADFATTLVGFRQIGQDGKKWFGAGREVSESLRPSAPSRRRFLLIDPFGCDGIAITLRLQYAFYGFARLAWLTPGHIQDKISDQSAPSSTTSWRRKASSTSCPKA